MSIRIFPFLCLIHFAILLLPVGAHAQVWRVVESGVSSTLEDIMFVNTRIGWAGGTDSTLIKTTDGGDTWFGQYPAIGGNVKAMWFVDEMKGFLVGGGISKGSGIHKTTDGGETWEQYSTLGDFEDIQFVGKDTGWAIGYRIRRIWKTTNGGDDWFELGSELYGVFKSCSFISNLEGWVAGAYDYTDNFSEEIIWHTTDGGETWELQKGLNRYGPLTEIHVLKSGIGFAYGWGIGIRTTNRGELWQLGGPGSFVSAMFAVDEEHIHLHRGFADERWMYMSADTGKTWSHVACEQKTMARGMYFLNPEFGFAVGTNGRIWRFDTTTVGVENIPEASSFSIVSVYPNPVGGSQQTATLRYSAVNSSDIKILMSDLLGREVYATSVAVTAIGEQHVQLPLRGLRQGVYVIRASSNTAGVERAAYTMLFVR